MHPTTGARNEKSEILKFSVQPPYLVSGFRYEEKCDSVPHEWKTEILGNRTDMCYQLFLSLLDSMVAKAKG
jgi:hypothetical protein